jgi:hypothetical protein
VKITTGQRQADKMEYLKKNFDILITSEARRARGMQSGNAVTKTALKHEESCHP